MTNPKLIPHDMRLHADHLRKRAYALREASNMIPWTDPQSLEARLATAIGNHADAYDILAGKLNAWADGIE